MNTYLKYQPPAMQFFSFWMLAGGFFFLNILLSTLFFKDIYASLLDTSVVITPEVLTRFKWAQFVTSTISFIAPALLFGYFSSPKALSYVGLKKGISPILLIAAVVFLVSIQPFVSWLGNLNGKINFGAWQKELLEKEALYNRALSVFLQMKSGSDLLVNLFIMALLPAVGEELFFRGALQKSLLRWSNKPWLAILLSAAFFAFLHGTFFKILPIFMLGILLGVVYYITRNLWYCIVIHFINNALAVLAVYYANRSEMLRKLADDSISVPVYAAVISLVIGLGIIYFIKIKSDEVFPEVTEEDEDKDFA